MKLSIITVTLNDLAGLQRTLVSLAGQSASQFEQWVIDGGSTDGTDEWLARHQPAWKFHFLSEKDDGVYDAMNKGTAHATGEYVWFLNAGDTCAETTTIEAILRQLEEDAATDVLYGRVWARSEYGLRSVGEPVTQCDFSTRMPLCHQGIVYRRNLLRRLPYPTEYRIVSDWIVTRTFLERGAVFRFFDRYFAVYDLTGVSSRNHVNALKEMLRHEKTVWAKFRVLVGQGGHILSLWTAKKTGLYHMYKKLQHSRPGKA